MSVKTNITIYMSDIVFACKENSCKKTMTDCVQSLKAKLIQNTTIRSQERPEHFGSYKINEIPPKILAYKNIVRLYVFLFQLLYLRHIAMYSLLMCVAKKQKLWEQEESGAGKAARKIHDVSILLLLTHQVGEVRFFFSLRPTEAAVGRRRRRTPCSPQTAFHCFCCCCCSCLCLSSSLILSSLMTFEKFKAYDGTYLQLCIQRKMMIFWGNF